MRKLKFAFFVVIFCSTFSYSFAQQQVDISQLSDQQLQMYINQANLSGLSDAELELKAREKGLSDEQIQQLKMRIAKLGNNSSLLNSSSKQNAIDNSELRKKVLINNNNKVIDSSELKVYGSDLFTKENLTFEPNLQIPTPKNYVIGTGDKINIDIFGYSDASYKLLVNPEGIIRIPNLGPIKVAGLNFEDAQQKIRSSLVKIYPQISNGKTSVDVSLGQIRTIRITLVGEVYKPGTYSLPSLATIANALYVSGGPNKIGSYRSIDLIRNGKVVVKFDLYDFLLNGNLTKNLMLQDDDIIKVNSYDARITIDGAIKRKAIYEIKSDETLDQLLKIAGGFNEFSYTEFIRVSRNTKSNREALIVKENEYSKFKVHNGDIYKVDSITNRYGNRVMIIGAVNHPGVYSVQNFQNLKDLILAAGLKEEAFLNRGVIRRRDTSYLPSMIDFNVNAILNGSANVKLQREDSVRIFSLYELRQRDSVTVNGEVNKPGGFTFAEGMQLQDVILLSGGFKEGASNKRIEVSRRIRTNSENDSLAYSIIRTFTLEKDLLTDTESAKYLLQPYDIISVRKNPTYQEQITVSIEGEVLYPGKYAIEAKTETVSSLVKRAGGLRSTAYTEGAVLLRNTFSDSISASYADDRLKAFKIQNLNVDSLSKVVVNNNSVEGQKIVGMNLKAAVEKPGSSYDILLNEGDILKVPQLSQTIQTFGAVYVPKKIIYSSSLDVSQIISESGGFLENANKRKLYVMYPNGIIKRTHHFLLFKSYPKVKPGSEVYVPTKRIKTLQENLSIGTAAASVAGLIISLIYLVKVL